jgi:hypothetical protein
MAGHESTNKTKERIISSYKWPGMDTEIDIHITPSAKEQEKTKEAGLPLQVLCPNALSQIEEFIWTYLEH